MKQMMTQNEESLIGEIHKFANHILEHKNKANIILSEKQFKILKTMIKRVEEHKALDRMNYIDNLDVDKMTYLGLNIEIKKEARKRYSKRDLQEFDFT